VFGIKPLATTWTNVPASPLVGEIVIIGLYVIVSVVGVYIVDTGVGSSVGTSMETVKVVGVHPPRTNATRVNANRKYDDMYFMLTSFCIVNAV